MRVFCWTATILVALLLTVLVASVAAAQAPVISNVQAGNVTATSAVITWTTDQLSNSLVNYGNSTPPTSTKQDGTFVTAHSIALNSLTPSTLYYYEVVSTNSNGNTTVDNNGGSYYQFTTLSGNLTISDVAVVGITDTSATITWTTDQPGNSTVRYGNTTDLGLSVSSGAFVTEHELSLGNLTPLTLYYFEVGSAPAGGNITVDNNGGDYYSFTTLYRVELIGSAWCSRNLIVTNARLEGYASVVTRSDAPEGDSLHVVGNLTLGCPGNQTVEVDLYGNRVRSVFYLRQETTGKSVTLAGAWIDAGNQTYYIGAQGMAALPNPDGELFKTARLYFVILRTPEIDVPLAEPGGWVDSLEAMVTRFVDMIDRFWDSAIGGNFKEILNGILVRLATLVAGVRELLGPYIP